MEVTCKFCPKCESEKPSIDFGKANRRDGLRSWCKSCESQYRSAREQEIRRKCIDTLGGKCTRCGFSDYRALQIDHVYGGGNKEHKQIKNSYAFYTKVLLDTNGLYQILCANCNWIKRSEQKEIPKDYSLSEAGYKKLTASRGSPSPETIEKLRQSHLGKIPSDRDKELKRKLTSESWKNPEIIEKRLAGLKKAKIGS